MAGPGIDEARALAVRALGLRDLSRTALAGRLRSAGIGEDSIRETVEQLASAGFVDDTRLARGRAEALAAQGLGNAAIAARLERDGIGSGELEEALLSLEDEQERARAFAFQQSETSPRRLAAILDRRGFSEEAIEAALASLDGGGGAELR